jgi:hypothetical protein
VKCGCGEVFRDDDPEKLATMFGIHRRSKYDGKWH